MQPWKFVVISKTALRTKLKREAEKEEKALRRMLRHVQIQKEEKDFVLLFFDFPKNKDAVNHK